MHIISFSFILQKPDVISVRPFSRSQRNDKTVKIGKFKIVQSIKAQEIILTGDFVSKTIPIEIEKVLNSGKIMFTISRTKSAEKIIRIFRFFVFKSNKRMSVYTNSDRTENNRSTVPKYPRLPFCYLTRLNHEIYCSPLNIVQRIDFFRFLRFVKTFKLQ